MTHELKIQKQWADAKLAGEKPFEIRRNDRGFQKGDIVHYTVIDPKTGEPWRQPESGVPFHPDGRHPLEICDFLITYVREGADGLKKGYCVYADQPVPEAKGRSEVTVDPVMEIPKIKMQLCELDRTVRILQDKAPERSPGECGLYEPDESFLFTGEKPCKYYRPESGLNSTGSGTCGCPSCIHCGHECPTRGGRSSVTVCMSSPVSADLRAGATPSNRDGEPLPPPVPLAEAPGKGAHTDDSVPKSSKVCKDFISGTVSYLCRFAQPDLDHFGFRCRCKPSPNFGKECPVERIA